MTIHSAEGIAVLVIVYVLGTAFLVFYFKWRKATTELRKCRYFLDDKRETRTSIPTADKKPISFGQIESCSNAVETQAPITAPTTRLSRTPLTIAGMIRRRLSKGRKEINQ